MLVTLRTSNDFDADYFLFFFCKGNPFSCKNVVKMAGNFEENLIILMKEILFFVFKACNNCMIFTNIEYNRTIFKFKKLGKSILCKNYKRNRGNSAWHIVDSDNKCPDCGM
jgi:hypothetical protein